jgi:hypothetical protein
MSHSSLDMQELGYQRFKVNQWDSIKILYRFLRCAGSALETITHHRYVLRIDRRPKTAHDLVMFCFYDDQPCLLAKSESGTFNGLLPPTCIARLARLQHGVP